MATAPTSAAAPGDRQQAPPGRHRAAEGDRARAHRCADREREPERTAALRRDGERGRAGARGPGRPAPARSRRASRRRRTRTRPASDARRPPTPPARTPCTRRREIGRKRHPSDRGGEPGSTWPGSTCGAGGLEHLDVERSGSGGSVNVMVDRRRCLGEELAGGRIGRFEARVRRGGRGEPTTMATVHGAHAGARCTRRRGPRGSRARHREPPSRIAPSPSPSGRTGRGRPPRTRPAAYASPGCRPRRSTACTSP